MKNAVFIFLAGFTIAAARQVNFYRTDYTYFPETDAYYKIHWNVKGVSKLDAKITCENEQSVLFPQYSPKFAQELELLKRLKPEVSDILTGLELSIAPDFFGNKYYETSGGFAPPSPLVVEPQSDNESCVLLNVVTGKYRSTHCEASASTARTFVCKTEGALRCPTVDSGYKNYRAAPSCYKVHKEPQTWADAKKTCEIEGAELIALKDRGTEDWLDRHDLTEDTLYFAGFRRLSADKPFKMIDDHELDTRFFNDDNLKNAPNNENCGAIMWQNREYITKTSDCGATRPFICVMWLPAVMDIYVHLTSYEMWHQKGIPLDFDVTTLPLKESKKYNSWTIPKIIL